MKKLQLIILLSFLSFATHAQVTANFMASATVACLPDATIQFTNQSTSVEPIATYSWDINGVTSGTTEHFTYTFSQSGLYDINLTLTDVSGNLDSYNVIVNIVDAPTAQIEASGLTINCITTSITLDGSNSISSSGNPLEYIWVDQNGNEIGTTAFIELTAVGTYTLEVTDTGNGCSGTSSVTVTADTDIPIVDAGPDQTLTCLTPSVTLDGSGSDIGNNFIHEWFDPSGTIISNTINTNVVMPGIYTLVVTNTNNGCTSSDQVLISEDTNIPNINLTTVVGCPGELVSIVPSMICTGCTIELYDPNGILICTSLPCSFTPIGGIYTVTVFNPNNGCSSTDQFSVAIPAPIEISYTTTNPTCNGGTDGAIDITVTGGSPPYSYSWSNGASTEDIFGLSANSHNVIVTDANGCASSELIFLNEAANLGLIITNDTTICAGETVQLEVSWIPTVVLPVQWTPTITINDPNITNPIVAPIATTTYTVVVTESIGCTALAEVTVTVDDNCVWPGDTDTNKVVNNFDLLNIGLAFDAVGPSRANASLSWTGQPADEWTQSTPTTNVNYKHIDTDGNGLINSDDTLAITQNWGLMHNFTGTSVFEQFTDLPIADGSVATAPFYVEPDTLPEGETIGLDIILGDVTNMVTGLYGIAFSIEYDSSVVVPESASIDFSNSWLGDVNADAISIQKNFSTPGRIDAAITRIDGMEMDGAGFFGTFIITLEDDILLWDPKKDETDNDVFADFKITNYHLINFSQEEILVEGATTTAPISNDVNTSIHNTYLDQQIQLYPNPANELFFIASQNIFIEEVKIYSTTKLIKALKTNTTDVIEIPTMDLPNGIYFIELQTEEGVVTKKVSVIK